MPQPPSLSLWAVQLWPVFLWVSQYPGLTRLVLTWTENLTVFSRQLPSHVEESWLAGILARPMACSWVR